MKTIIIATDFSNAASNAADYAADMALAINANLLLLHVYQVPVIFSEMPVTANTEQMIKDAEKEIVKQKERIIKKLNNQVNIETDLREGVFFHELKTVCENIMPYAVVLGSQGTTAADHFLFGSHTVNAMKHLTWPLIAVPPKAKFSTVKKIGLACDFNKVVDTTPIDDIAMLVKDFDAELHVLNTGKKKVFDPEIVFESGLLQEMLIDLKPKYDFITNENIDEGIINFADTNHIDLLVILPKRHTLFDKLFHRSHTKQFVLHSHVPVMALHQ